MSRNAPSHSKNVTVYQSEISGLGGDTNGVFPFEMPSGISRNFARVYESFWIMFQIRDIAPQVYTLF